MNNWRKAIDYFNSKVSGKIFTRAEVQTHFGLNAPRRLATVQTYMNTFRRGGYLAYIEPGVYRKLKKIPDVSEHQMKKDIRRKQ